jgi:hypothetical protein
LKVQPKNKEMLKLGVDCTSHLGIVDEAK